MRSPKIGTVIALASIATALGACATSRPPAVDPLAGGHRVTLPDAPEGVEECLRRVFPSVPDRALTKGDVVGLVGAAKVLDRAKTACGLRAVAWIEDVRAQLAR